MLSPPKFAMLNKKTGKYNTTTKKDLKVKLENRIFENGISTIKNNK